MQIVVDVPQQYLLDMTIAEMVQQLKLSTALLMFQSGQFSAGAACEFAGVDRYTFWAACKKYGIDVIAYDEEELEADVQRLQRRFGK